MSIAIAVLLAAGIGAAALQLAEALDTKPTEDGDAVDRAVADVRAILAEDQVSQSHGLPMDDDGIRPLHWREAAEWRWITVRLDQDF